MDWVFWILGGLLVLFVVSKFRGNKTQNKKDINSTLHAPLSDEEKLQFANDIRDQVKIGYDRGYEKAESDGQNVDFCHEIGILDAGFAVLANDNASRNDDNIRASIQMEIVPFNRIDPGIALVGLQEYLVWKFVPELADESKIETALNDFVGIIHEKSESEEDTDEAIYRMIYSGKYDWQQFAVAASKRRVDNA